MFRIHFNAGDRWFSDYGIRTDYLGNLEQWPTFLQTYIRENTIRKVVLYGDCRAIHRTAITVAKAEQCKVYALEEGYLRPDWITCEQDGVNAASTLLKRVDFLQEKKTLLTEEKTDTTGSTFFQRFYYATAYYVMMEYYKREFNQYQSHHIHPSPWVQAGYWLTNFYRKQAYKAADQLSLKQVKTQFGRNFFLLPLQVATDSQIRHHSDFASIEQLIETTLQSFAKHADRGTALLIKHHPMDRGHSHYGNCIRALADKFQLKGRVFYGHDWPLPTLLRHTRGVVTLNSTVGISALLHNLPVKVVGKAFWDMPDITSQQTLDEFWVAPKRPTKAHVDYLIGSIRVHTQIKGSFYKHIPDTAKRLADKLCEPVIIHQTPSSSLKTTTEANSIETA